MTIEEEFEDTLLTKKKFTQLVEDKVLDFKIGYIEAVVEVCNDRGLDTSDVGNLISPILKGKIEAEAMGLNLIKGGNQLPI